LRLKFDFKFKMGRWGLLLSHTHTHTHKQIQATHCLSSLHPGPALAVTRCHPKSITIVYVLILFLSLGVTTHGTHKKTSFDMYALSRSWSRLRVLVTTSNGVLRLVRTVPVLVSPTSPGDDFNLKRRPPTCTHCPGPGLAYEPCQW